MSVPGALVVVAFDGEALSTPERIRAAAGRLVMLREEPAAVVALLSAPGDTSADLHELACRVARDPVARELDMLLAAGERISCALCAMALLDRGVRAVSLSGSQAGIVTDTAHGRASIVDVRPRRVLDELAAGAVVLVAGGQGVSTRGEVTRLGPVGLRRGAIALAGALAAARCELVTGDPCAPSARLFPAGTGPLPLERTA
jgi:aspartate kinase